MVAVHTAGQVWGLAGMAGGAGERQDGCPGCSGHDGAWAWTLDHRYLPAKPEGDLRWPRMGGAAGNAHRTPCLNPVSPGNLGMTPTEPGPLLTPPSDSRHEGSARGWRRANGAQRSREEEDQRAWGGRAAARPPAGRGLWGATQMMTLTIQ